MYQNNIRQLNDKVKKKYHCNGIRPLEEFYRGTLTK